MDGRARGRAARGTGNEGRDAHGIGSIGLPPARAHVRLERRNAGDVDEQRPHHRRRGDGETLERAIRDPGEREQREAAPDQPFEEIVGMARPPPEPRVADRAGRRRATKPAQLRVGERFPGEPREDDQGRGADAEAARWRARASTTPAVAWI